MTARSSTQEALRFDPPERSGSFRYGRPGRDAAYSDSSDSKDAWLFNFERCLEAYDQGLDVSRAFDPAKFLAITDELYAGIPFPVVEVDYQPYQDVYDMGELVKRQETLYISTLHGPTYWSSEVTTRTRAVHDWYAHILPGNNFSWEGELNAYRSSLALYPGELQWLVYSELVLQVAQLLARHGVEQKIVYCRNGEPLRTYEAWRTLNGEAKGGSSRQRYHRYVHEFLAAAEVPFSIPELLKAQ